MPRPDYSAEIDSLLSQNVSRKTRPSHNPTDAFMDELYNNGALPEIESMFLKSGQVDPWHPGAGTYATRDFYDNPKAREYYGKMHQWLRKQNSGVDYDRLRHPKLRGEPGPAPNKEKTSAKRR